MTTKISSEMSAAESQQRDHRARKRRSLAQLHVLWRRVVLRHRVLKALLAALVVCLLATVAYTLAATFMSLR